MPQEQVGGIAGTALAWEFVASFLNFDIGQTAILISIRISMTKRLFSSAILLLSVGRIRRIFTVCRKISERNLSSRSGFQLP